MNTLLKDDCTLRIDPIVLMDYTGNSVRINEQSTNSDEIYGGST